MSNPAYPRAGSRKTLRRDAAMRLLGGDINEIASEIGVSRQAVMKWPDPLPPRIEDRVFAALYRRMTAPARSSRRKAA